MTSRDVSRRQPRRLRFGLRTVFLAIALGAVFLSAIYNNRTASRIKSENRRLEQENQSLRGELAALKMQTRFERLEEDLKIPNAGLYRQYFPWQQFNQTRWEALERHGVERFAPYWDVFYNGREPYDYLQGFPEDSRWALDEDKRTNQASFLEGFHVNYPRGACNRLLGALRDQQFRAYLKENPELFTRRLRPLLMRMALAPEANWRYHACETLLELGDRSPMLLDVLRRSLDRPDEPPADARYPDKRSIEFLSYDPDAARRLVAKYELNALLSDVP